MPIVTVNGGLKAIANAEAGGFLVDLTHFAMTEANGVRLSIEDSALAGTPVYSAEIQSLEVVSGSTVKATLYIPPGLPRSGSWRLTEIGLYLKSGEMFAHGTFKVPYDKNNEFGLKVYVFVTAARLGEVINITIGTNASLASTANVRSLIEPSKSDTNAVIVQDGQTNLLTAATPTSGSLAIRYGAGGRNWAFLGHDLQYRGHVTSVIDNSNLVLNIQKQGGFWMNHNEISIIQIVDGPGAGESRRVRYNRDRIRFEVLEKPFSAVGTDSLLHIWRSTKEVLPTRSADIPELYVLGVGKNTWKEEAIANSDSSSDLKGHRVSLKGDGQSVSFPLAGVPRATVIDKNNFMVFVAGELVPYQSFVTSAEQGLTLFTTQPAVGDSIEVLAFERVASSGSALIFSTAEEDADGSVWTFNLSIVPDTADYILVFVDGKLQPADSYIFAGTSVTFTQAAPIGKVALVAFGNFIELGASTQIYHQEGSAILNDDGSFHVIQVAGAETLEQTNTFVMANGRRLSFDSYEVEGNLIVLKNSVSVDDKISIIAFESSVEPVLITSFSGENTGPVWVDPAGAYVGTNRLEAKRVTERGDGVRATFSMQSRADKAFVFIAGLFQDPRTITVDAESGTLTLPSPLEANMEMDIISFESFPDTGREMTCWRQKFTTVAGRRNYVIDAPKPGWEPMVSIMSMGGVYVHASAYTQTPTSITFNSDVEPNLNVEIWHFASLDHPGYSSILSFGSHTLDETKTQYVHAYYDHVPIVDSGRIDNTLLFGSTVYQLGDQYTVDNATAYRFNIPNVGSATTVHATSVVFYTGKSKTRLVLRDELARYMTRDEILNLAFNGTYTPPTGGGGDTGGGTGGDTGGTNGGDARAMFLSATSQIFAIDGTGAVSPSTITFTANPQNIDGPVTFAVLGGTATLSTAGRVATLAYSNMSTDTVTVRARATDTFNNVSYFDDVTVVKLQDGSDSINAILTNESHTLGADVNGVVGSYVGASTSMEIYRGTTKETDKWTFTRANGAGITSTITGNTVSITGITTSSSYIDITASRTGFASIVKRFSVSLSKTGLSGTNGSNGANAIMAMLSNESYTFAADGSGNVTDFSQGKTTITVFSGQTDDSANWTFSKNDSSGVASTLSGRNVSITAFANTNDTGTVTITATRSGYPTLTKQFTLSKAKGTTGSGSGGTNGVDGKRGSMTFYVPNQTSWSDPVATAAATYGGGVILNDTVVEYSNSTGYSQTRFWNGSAWVILTQVVDGNLLVRGTVGADKMSVGTITAASGIIANAAIETLKIAGNAVTQAQATQMGSQQQLEISTTGVGQAVLNMVVQVTGTQPILVWSSFSMPGCRLGTASDYDAYYWGQYWKMNSNPTPQWSECVAQFRLSGANGTFYAGNLSTSVYPGYTLSAGLSAVFTDIPAGTYTLSLMLAKPLASIVNFAVRSGAMAFLETKR